jgi:predicted transcriptional regulator
LKKGYSQWKIASELGVSLTTVYQWLTGYTLTARPETIERLKKFLSTQAYKAFAAIRRADAGFVSEEAGLLIF